MFVLSRVKFIQFKTVAILDELWKWSIQTEIGQDVVGMSFKNSVLFYHQSDATEHAKRFNLNTVCLLGNAVMHTVPGKVECFRDKEAFSI